MSKKKSDETPKQSPKTSPKSKRRSRHVFYLKDLDLGSLEKRYGILLVEEKPVHATNIKDINYATDNCLSFVDETKTEHACTVSMIDFSTGSDVQTFKYKCFWCKNQPNPDTRQLGCPIRYVPNRVIKSYFSEISKETRVITGSATREEKSQIMERIAPKVGYIQSSNPIDKLLSKSRYSYSMVAGEHYITDGVFCSFDCMSAFINENQTVSLYSHSKSLMIKMYKDMTGLKNTVINPAPHWRQLKEYGGEKTIEDFRSSFNRVRTQCHGVVKSEPVFKPIGILFEEKLNF